MDAAAPSVEQELLGLATFVYEQSGISPKRGLRKLSAMPLSKRLHQLGLHSLAAYEQYLRLDPGGAEAAVLLDAVTTNHTSFFREPAHFAWLHDAMAAGPHNEPLDVWCAASATGEEPYSIAVTLREAGVTRVRLLATDISTEALRVAAAGVYQLDVVEAVPAPLRRRYFEKGLGAYEGLARVAPALRDSIEFRRLNLMDVGDLGRTFAVIFCRNVLIYFDQASRQRAVSALEAHLAPGGHLVVAHTERLSGIRHGLVPVQPSVYWKPA